MPTTTINLTGQALSKVDDTNVSGAHGVFVWMWALWYANGYA